MKAGGQLPHIDRRARRIAVIPVYNEETSVVSVLQRLEPLVDEIVVVDDGSADASRQLILEWAAGRAHVRPILFDENRGLSAAYYAAFSDIRSRVESGELSGDDAVITVDADGQHEPSDVDALVGQLQDAPYDAVIARRDLSGYTPFKRFGNWLLSIWATLWAGSRLHDVESGFRVFRAAPLLDALQYYRGYRYSETVEVAIVLARLGYRICNDVMVRVPVCRSRTRLRDGVIDALAMVGAWWRVIAGRYRPRDMPAWSLYVVPPLAVLGLLLVSTDMLIHPLFLASDSMHSYAHVWYISEQIFDHARIPTRIGLLDDGHAAAFPYAFVPYLLGAVLFPLLGDLSVTLLMVIAVLGTVWAAGRVRPVMRDPWFILLFLLNPFFIDTVFGFAFATVWMTLFFFLFVWAFEQRSYLLAGALLWLAVSSHPVIGAAAAGTYGVCILLFDRKRLRPLVLIAIPAAVLLIPIYWMTLLTPAVRENSLLTIGRSTVASLLARGSVIAMPFALTLLAPYLRRYYRPALAAFAVTAVVGTVLMSGIVRYDHSPGGYYGIVHRSSDVYADFFRSPVFAPGATYRVLEPTEREDGMYRFIRHGAVLSNEFFNESVFRRSWTEDQYRCYGAFKGIDFVVAEKAYFKRYRMNEGDILDSLVHRGEAAVVYTDPAGRFTVYDVRNFVSHSARPSSLSQCGVF